MAYGKHERTDDDCKRPSDVRGKWSQQKASVHILFYDRCYDTECKISSRACNRGTGDETCESWRSLLNLQQGETDALSFNIDQSTNLVSYICRSTIPVEVWDTGWCLLKPSQSTAPPGAQELKQESNPYPGMLLRSSHWRAQTEA